MAKDFERQQSLRPSLSKAVFHGIISFYPGEKIDDKMMVEIAKEYLQNMKITDTQFVIVKHIDKNHQHLHIITNLINNNGETIRDNWIGLRGKKIAQKLTLTYGLKEAVSKNLSLIKPEALNEKEATKYVIYQAILESLPNTRNLDDLKERLMKKNIETLYKYKGQTNELQGISFKIGNFKYKGSEIDRKFSVLNLQKEILKQRLSQHQFIAGSTLSKSLSQKRYPEQNIEFKNQRTLLDDLLKTEKQGMNIAGDFNPHESKKKKSRRFHF
ncbi:MAG: relaxase/mobilization nuclease domain-containing protein [Bacteroidota bacterium]|nr:relaxase/mobilization nuclease domain-containing protein [Bacteroidota bacterium]